MITVRPALDSPCPPLSIRRLPTPNAPRVKLVPHSAGLVSDPTAPVEVGYFDTGDVASSVYMDSGRIYLADRYDGLYILQNDLLSGAPDGELPLVTRLNSVYPNPFNPQMSVSFSVAQAQQVSLAVFDLAGNRIAVIADRRFETGTHAVLWNGRDASGRAVSSGVYLVQMEAAGLSESQKVTLLR